MKEKNTMGVPVIPIRQRRVRLRSKRSKKPVLWGKVLPKSGSILIRKLLKINIKADWFNSRMESNIPLLQRSTPVKKITGDDKRRLKLKGRETQGGPGLHIRQRRPDLSKKWPFVRKIVVQFFETQFWKNRVGPPGSIPWWYQKPS